MTGVLVGSNGMMFYTVGKDLADAGKVACNGPGATNWPPLLAMDVEGSNKVWHVAKP